MRVSPLLSVAFILASAGAAVAEDGVVNGLLGNVCEPYALAGRNPSGGTVDEDRGIATAARLGLTIETREDAFGGFLVAFGEGYEVEFREGCKITLPRGTSRADVERQVDAQYPGWAESLRNGRRSWTRPRGTSPQDS
jgi:hypothetical protein